MPDIDVLTWATARPTSPGYYWYKEAEVPMIVEVKNGKFGGLVWSIGPYEIKVSDSVGIWAGPIPQPVSKEIEHGR